VALERLSGGEVVACDLCEAAVITKRYADDELCWIADCEICLVPMIVWREHSATPSDEIRAELARRLAVVADEVLGEGGWKLDDNMRNIPTTTTPTRGPHASGFASRGGFGSVE
jgi:hypothetical protein